MTKKDKVLIYPESIEVEAGSHAILIYKDPEELIEFLGHYFYIGLKNGEICFLIGDKQVFVSVKKEIQKNTDINQKLLDDNLIYIDYREFYLTKGMFSIKEIFIKIDAVLNKYANRRIRITGDGSWVDKIVLNDFYQYEVEVSKRYNEKNIVIVCTYLSKKLDIEDVIKITDSHTYILFKENGLWKMSETIEKSIYEQKIKELEIITDLSIDRELKMIELKGKVEKLESELKKIKKDD